MALQNKVKLIGPHFRFAPEGATHAGGTVSASSKPASADDAAYIKDNECTSISTTKNKETLEKFAPSPGRTRRSHFSTYNLSHDFEITLQRNSRLTRTLIHGSALIGAADTQANPLSGKDIYGWAHIEGWDEDDEAYIVHDEWVHLDMDSEEFNGQGDDLTIMARGIYNTLNTISFPKVIS